MIRDTYETHREGTTMKVEDEESLKSSENTTQDSKSLEEEYPVEVPI